MHLRNTLAKGMDAESYSLHTFEALLSQSMENLELAESLPGSNQRSPYPMRRRSGSAKSSTLPLPHGRPVQIRERDRERDGYYSDRNELVRERERERERGYLSDHNSGYACPLCFLSVNYPSDRPFFRPLSVTRPVVLLALESLHVPSGFVIPTDGVRAAPLWAPDRHKV